MQYLMKQILRKIKQFGTYKDTHLMKFIPKIFHFGGSFHNYFKYKYILMNLILEKSFYNCLKTNTQKNTIYFFYSLVFFLLRICEKPLKIKFHE